MEYEEKVCNFKKYLKQTMDLLEDAYKWKAMAETCDNMETKNKYMTVSNTLYELFMTEHNNVGNIFKNM